MNPALRSTARPPLPARLRGIIRQTNGLFNHIPQDLVTLTARVCPAVVFWQSARTKVEGLTIKESTYFLFENVYMLPLIPPVPATIVTTVAEHILPALLILGLFSRLSALGLLTMTAVIQIFVFPEAWVTHGLWVAALFVTLKYGPGRLSLDSLFRLDSASRTPVTLTT